MKKNNQARTRDPHNCVRTALRATSYSQVLVGVFSLSALTTSGTAFAQSSITLYGVIDTSIEVTNTGRHTTVRMDSGSQIGSMIGVKGREALGGGYYVDFRLEDGFFSQSGAAADPTLAFSRQAWVGLVGPFGSLRVGRQQTAVYEQVSSNLDAFNDVSMASGFNNFLTLTPRTNNAIRYDSPSFHGFVAQLMVALRDTTTVPSNGVESYYVTFEYNNNGPVNTEGGYMSTGSPINGVATRTFYYGLSYGYKNLRVYGSFSHASIGTQLDKNDFGLSTRYQASAFDFLMVGYAYVRDMTTAHNSADQFGVEYQHFLSKRTFVYVDGGYLRNRRNATFTLNGATVAGLPADYPGAPIRGIQFGIQHRF
ncbi:UNVERIFIED_ORG: putative porin [Paraburkholderia sediminicola]|nr:putative porin [Paraburkholderia sediminicola]